MKVVACDEESFDLKQDQKEKTPSKPVVITIANTIGFMILYGVSFTTPPFMVIVGLSNFYNCPLQQFIPIWLTIAGFSFACQLILAVSNYPNKLYDNENPPIHCAHAFTFLSCFNFTWLIIGSVVMYKSSFMISHKSNSSFECDFMTYYLAFWIIVSLLTFFCLAVSYIFLSFLIKYTYRWCSAYHF